MTMCTRHPAVPPQRRGLFATLLLAVLCVIWGPASAQQRPCAPIADVEAGLASAYGEKAAATGGTENTITVIFINPETGTFTIAVAGTDGIACLVTAGEHWRLIGSGK